MGMASSSVGEQQTHSLASAHGLNQESSAPVSMISQSRGNGVFDLADLQEHMVQVKFITGGLRVFQLEMSKSLRL